MNTIVFETKFAESKLPGILQGAKSLSGPECEAVFEYLKTHRPCKLLVYSTQESIIVQVIEQMAQWLDLKLSIRCINKSSRGFEKQVIMRYQPDLIFMNGREYYITSAVIKTCVKNKIDFMLQGIIPSLLDRCALDSDKFKNKEVETTWEAYLLGSLINKKLLSQDKYTSNKFKKVSCVKHNFGLAVIEM